MARLQLLAKPPDTVPGADGRVRRRPAPGPKGPASAGQPQLRRGEAGTAQRWQCLPAVGAGLVLSDGPLPARIRLPPRASDQLQKNAAQVAQRLWLMRAVGAILAFRDSQGTAQEGAGGRRSGSASSEVAQRSASVWHRSLALRPEWDTATFSTGEDRLPTKGDRWTCNFGRHSRSVNDSALCLARHARHGWGGVHGATMA